MNPASKIVAKRDFFGRLVPEMSFQKVILEAGRGCPAVSFQDRAL